MCAPSWASNAVAETTRPMSLHNASLRCQVVVTADGELLRRHTFVRVDTDALASHWPLDLDCETAEFVLAWFAAQRPAICTSSDASLSSAFISAGIATPPA